ncbi:hypothetical protein OsJ_33086 [Oryza sativa Japonica Group]|uniref:Uncharacterized protein n=1 Tax=Oryza sativa subsp. japonica TaxID=39947 RepID=B9G9J9_ORYSJ|nr:hypothetical protein OsJ_33086 [Oryza sativa Japonica Group]
MSPDSYCVWVSSPSPASSPSRPPRKSGSTGSITWWRCISKLVIGRNHSDGKEKFRAVVPGQGAPQTEAHRRRAPPPPNRVLH